MRVAAQRADAALGVLKRDFLTAVSYRLTFVTQILTGFFSLMLFYYISRLVRVEPFVTADDYYAFAVIGLIILQVLNSTLMTPPGALRQELVAGTFERFVVSPFGPVGGILSMMLFPLIYALIASMLMLAFASLVFGVSVEWSTAGLAIPVGLLGALAFAPFGVLITALVLVAKQAMSGTTWIVALISLIAGLYFPVTLLPGWIEWASEVQPFTPAVDLLRHLLVGTPLADPAWVAATKIAAFAIVLMPASIWVLATAVRVSRRRGTIIEY